MEFRGISSATAVNLFVQLLGARNRQLHPALNRAVSAVGVPAIDNELHELVQPPDPLNYLATLHLRGELVFPVPSIIRYDAALIGYYRMLLGISKKEFSQATKLGYGPWASAEESGTLPARLEPYLLTFCKALVEPLSELLEATRKLKGIEDRDLSDLALLTLGPTLQGGRNNIIGQEAAREIFNAIKTLVGSGGLVFESDSVIQFQTPREDPTQPQRRFEVAVASDPDVRLDELFPLPEGTGWTRTPLVAIEIKGGRDRANAHNRAGEAEKSQIKSRDAGYRNRWTIIVLTGLDRDEIQGHTPNTTQLFDTVDIRHQRGDDWDRFKHCLVEVLGVGLA